MKTPIFLVLLLLAGVSSAQNNNGWAFLSWRMSKDSVEKVLIEKKDLLSRPTALDADFSFEGMNTWLTYDSLNRLIRVHQRKTFHVLKDKEAEAFYRGVKTSLKAKCGKPDHAKRDKRSKSIIMIWNLPETTIILEYNNEYKIIDEFGAGSYWIDIVFEPVLIE